MHDADDDETMQCPCGCRQCLNELSPAAPQHPSNAGANIYGANEQRARIIAAGVCGIVFVFLAFGEYILGEWKGKSYQRGAKALACWVLLAGDVVTVYFSAVNFECKTPALGTGFVMTLVMVSCLATFCCACWETYKKFFTVEEWAERELEIRRRVAEELAERSQQGIELMSVSGGQPGSSGVESAAVESGSVRRQRALEEGARSPT